MSHLSSVTMLNDVYRRAPTKTVTFTGGAGAGAVGTVAVWTISGRVRVHLVTAFCTTNLNEAVAGATVSLGTANDVDCFIAATSSNDIDANEWWTAAAPAAGSKSPLKVETGGLVTSQVDKLLSENVIITCATQATDAGVLVIDAWYEPITGGSSLT